MPNSSKITKVRSIRASFDFWDMIAKIAEKEKTNLNNLIIKVMTQYCGEKHNAREGNRLL
jgi:predicted DNA-binding ribbon-helix-helix protein